jgi:hypothetical protein
MMLLNSQATFKVSVSLIKFTHGVEIAIDVQILALEFVGVKYIMMRGYHNNVHWWLYDLSLADPVHSSSH